MVSESAVMEEILDDPSPIDIRSQDQDAGVPADGTPGTPEGGTPDGGTPDGGTPGDGGSGEEPPDGGTGEPADAGAGDEDGGSGGDGGTPPDGTQPPQEQSTETEPADAGVPEAGTPTDAGTETEPADAGPTDGGEPLPGGVEPAPTETAEPPGAEPEPEVEGGPIHEHAPGATHGEPEVQVLWGISAGTHGHFALQAQKGVFIGAGYYGSADNVAHTTETMESVTHIAETAAGAVAVLGSATAEGAMVGVCSKLIGPIASHIASFAPGAAGGPAAVFSAQTTAAILAGTEALLASPVGAGVVGGLTASLMTGGYGLVAAGHNLAVTAGIGKLEMGCVRGPVEIIAKLGDVFVSAFNSFVVQAKMNACHLETHTQGINLWAGYNAHFHPGHGAPGSATGKTVEVKAKNNIDLYAVDHLHLGAGAEKGSGTTGQPGISLISEKENVTIGAAKKDIVAYASKKIQIGAGAEAPAASPSWRVLIDHDGKMVQVGQHGNTAGKNIIAKDDMVQLYWGAGKQIIVQDDRIYIKHGNTEIKLDGSEINLKGTAKLNGGNLVVDK